MTVKQKAWMFLILLWITVMIISYRVMIRYGLLEKPLSSIGLEVE